MGNVNMEARQIHYRGGNKPMSVEEAINENAGDISSLESGFTNLDNEVNGDATVYPYADVITIEDAVPSNLADCKVKIEPVQDLHGYDKPWVGGAGKNKLPLTLDNLKALNTLGTWSDNVYTRDGITYTVNVDANGNVISITFSGASTSNVAIKFIFAKNFVLTETHILTSGIASTWNTDGYVVEASDSNEQKYSSTTLNGISLPAETYSVYLTIKNNQSISGNVTIYPMIRLSTETDATFAPYTNICPISGHTEAVVTVADDDTDPTVTNTYTIALGDTIYGGTVDFDSGVMTVTMAQIASYDGETIGEPWISDRDVYAAGTTPTTGAQVVYTLATPTTIQLTPQQIQLLKGQNTLTASTGEISVTVNGVSAAIGSVQTQANNTDEALAELAADIAEQLPDAPTTDGAYVLTVTVADGAATYSWESAT